MATGGFPTDEILQANKSTWGSTMSANDSSIGLDLFNTTVTGNILNDVFMNEGEPLDITIIDRSGFTEQNSKQNKVKRKKDLSPSEYTPASKKLSHGNQNHESDISNWVFIAGKTENITKKNPIKIKQALLGVDRSLNPKYFTKTGQSIKILTESIEQKEKLLKMAVLLGSEVIASEHVRLRHSTTTLQQYNKVIIFGVDTEITTDEIAEEVKADYVRRLKKRNVETGLLDDTPSVVLSFEGEPPPSVFIGWRKYLTKTFIERPVRCLKCQKFGHTVKFCHGKLCCPRCGGQHQFTDCSYREVAARPEDLHCPNCGQGHSAAFKECPAYIKAVEITTIKNQGKLTYSAAVKEHKLRTQSQQTNPERQSGPSRTDCNVEDFPSLPPPCLQKHQEKNQTISIQVKPLLPSITQFITNI